MRKTMLTAAGLLVAVGIFSAQGHAQTISENEYRNRALLLFKEFMQMKQDAVFLDRATIKLLGPNYKFSNTTRGDNPPGGWFGRPPGSDWLMRVKRLLGSGHKFVCFDIPTMPSEAGLCGHDLMSLHSAITAKDVSFLDSLAARFWLATICHKSPGACEPHIGD